MGKNSKISWTDDTFNPWWGCIKVSDGCKFCYAETQADRFGDWWGPKNQRRMFGDKHWNEPINWNRSAEKAGKPRRVFCGSMCDWLEEKLELVEPRKRLLHLIDDTPWLVWLMLTKRIENLASMVGYYWLNFFGKGIPRNVWIGVTTENQKEFDKRWPILEDFARTYKPAKVWLSVEPMLGPIDIEPAVTSGLLSWLITGTESGDHRRPMDLAWEWSIRQQCSHYHIPYFCKQAEIDGQFIIMPELDGQVWDQVPAIALPWVQSSLLP